MESMRIVENVVEWWDNYAHHIHRVRVSNADGTYRPVTWTGKALLAPVPASPPDDLRRNYDVDGVAVASMPLLEDMDEMMDEVLQDLLDVHRLEFDVFKINKEGIFNAPVKAGNDVQPQSVANFYSYDIAEDFVGSTEGFHRLLKDHCTKIQDAAFGDRYSILLYDIKPYYSLVHVSVFDSKGLCVTSNVLV